MVSGAGVLGVDEDGTWFLFKDELVSLVFVLTKPSHSSPSRQETDKPVLSQ